MSEIEEELPGNATSGIVRMGNVVRMGNTVRRPAGPWTDTVDAFLATEDGPYWQATRAFLARRRAKWQRAVLGWRDQRPARASAAASSSPA